jgi:hypothetical protein
MRVLKEKPERLAEKVKATVAGRLENKKETLLHCDQRPVF